MTSQKTQQKRDYEINKTVISCDAWHTDHDWSPTHGTQTTTDT